MAENPAMHAEVDRRPRLTERSTPLVRRSATSRKKQRYWPWPFEGTYSQAQQVIGSGDLVFDEQWRLGGVGQIRTD
jgi:hypothetical protein